MDVANIKTAPASPAKRPRGRPRGKLCELPPATQAARLERLAARRQVALAPLDPCQRYTIDEAIRYLRTSRKSLYEDVKAGRLKLLKDGRRSYVHGAELARRAAVSRLDA